MSEAIVTLKKGEGRMLKSGGLWIFDNEIASILGSFEDGDIVAVHDFDGYGLGKGFINRNSKIRVRMMTRNRHQEIDEALQATVCKNLFLCNRQETAFYLLMIPDTKTFHTKDLSAQIGSARLSFAKPEYMEKFLDITPGSVSVMGLMNDTEDQVQLLIDEDVLSGEMIGCHPCINTSSIRFKTSDLIEKILPAMHHSFIQVKL